MISYIKFFFHLFRHKYYVLIECSREGLFWQGLTHDLSKLRWREFKPYSNKLFGRENNPEAFRIARRGHQLKSRHHWQYWIRNGDSSANEMDRQYVIEMVCDWRAMGRTWEDSAPDFYRNNRSQMILHPKTRIQVEELLRIKPVQ